MKDVARIAGVSPKTVSNVITGTVTVRSGTRARVERAMQELDFVPNLNARGLRNGRSGMIGVALPDLGTDFSASISHALLEAAHRRGLAVQVEETAAEPQREYDLVSRARTHLVDGLVLNPVRLDDSVVGRMEHLPPIVLIGEVEQHRTDRVFVNSRAATRTVTSHLIAQGARRIVALGSMSNDAGAGTATVDQRLRGYLDALEAAGLPASQELQAPVPQWTIEGGAAGASLLLERGTQFDAVVAFTDTLAVGVLHALREAGIRVPEDVLVTGFDDVEHARFSSPPLTTVHFSHQEYAEAALDLLTSRIEDRTLPPRAVEIPHSLAVRESSGAAPVRGASDARGARK